MGNGLTGGLAGGRADTGQRQQFPRRAGRWLVARLAGRRPGRIVGCHTNSWSRGGMLFQRGRINYAADGELGGKLAGCWPVDDGDKVHLKLAGWILCAHLQADFSARPEPELVASEVVPSGVDGLEGGQAGELGDGDVSSAQPSSSALG